MENQTKNISLKVILISITLGIWAIVLQNAGVIPTSQNVNVVNSVDTYVKGDVQVSGRVSVDNTVDINLKEIQGRSAGSRTSYVIDGTEYQSLDVSPR
jgi:uncharacterized membrane-anchored protein